MIIQNIIIQNFMRWIHLEFDLNQIGLNLIEGRNGQGKSSILEAILWCLYGKTLRGLAGDDVINNTIGKNCAVALHFMASGKSISVIRYRKHDQHKNELFLTVSGVDSRRWSNRSTQEDIIQIIGMDMTAFVNSVLFGGGLFKYFAGLTDKEQKTVLDALTGVSIYDDALKVVKEEYDSDKTLITTKISNLTWYQTAADNIAAELQTAQINYKNWETNRATRMTDKEAQRMDYAAKIASSEASIANMAIVTKEGYAQLQVLTAAKNKNVCSKCKQSLPFDRDAEIANLERVIRSAERDMAIHRSNINNYNKSIETLNKDLEAIGKETNAWGEIARQHVSTLHAHGVEISELEKVIGEMTVSQDIKAFWLEGFSNSGIKSLRLDSVAPFLTQRANEYSDMLTEGAIRISFQTQSALKSGEVRDKFRIQVINQEGHPSHEGSSMGERRCVDLCVLWALQDLARNQSSDSINVEFYDEIMDIMDDENTEKIMTIIRHRSKDRAIWVISHNDTLKGLFDTVYSVAKHKGASLIARR